MSLEQIKSDFKVQLFMFNKMLDQFNGRDAVIKEGKFAGRVGRIQDPHFDMEGNIGAMIRPYHKRSGSAKTLLWDHSDARTCWNLTDDMLIDEKPVVHKEIDITMRNRLERIFRRIFDDGK